MSGLFADPLFWLLVAAVGGLGFVGGVVGDWYDRAEVRDAKRRNRP